MSASIAVEIRGNVSPRTARDIAGVINRKGTNSSVAWIKWVGTRNPVNDKESDEFCLVKPPGRQDIPSELEHLREGTHTLGDIISIIIRSPNFYLSDRKN